MTLRQIPRALLFAGVVAGMSAAGASIERNTSVVTRAVQPHVLSPKWNRDAALTAELDATNRAVRHRIEVKEWLVAELLAGRASLADVTAQFLAMNQSSEASLLVVRCTFHGATDVERTARNVIQYASVEMAHQSPIERAFVLARLEFELREVVEHESRLSDGVQ